MTSSTEASATAEYIRRARAILFVGLSVAFIGAMLGIGFSFVPGSISAAELWLVGTCAVVSGVLLLVLAMKPTESLPFIAASAAIFFTFYLAAASLVAFFQTGELVLMFPYLFWYFPLIAFNKFTNPGKSRPYVDYLIIASAVLVFVVYVVAAEIEHYALQLGAPSVFILSFVCFALFLNLFAQYRERYVAEAERLQALETASTSLRQNDERLRQLFDSSGTGIGYLGINGTIQSCNNTFLEITRFDASLGHSFEELVHTDDRDTWREGFRRLANRESVSFDFEGKLAGKGPHPGSFMQISSSRRPAGFFPNPSCSFAAT